MTADPEIGEMTLKPGSAEPPAAGGDGKNPTWNHQREPGPQKELGYLISRVKRGQGTVISSHTVCGDFLGLLTGGNTAREGLPLLHGSHQPENNGHVAMGCLPHGGWGLANLTMNKILRSPREGCRWACAAREPRKAFLGTGAREEGFLVWYPR